MVACEIPAEIQVPVKVMGFFDLQLPVRQTAPPTTLNATENLFIWNPTTGDYRKLPDPFLSSEAYLSQLFVYGFGYDSSTDVYKLFLGRTEGVVQSSMEAEIFSLRRNSWRMIENPPYLETNDSNNGTETPCSLSMELSFERRAVLLIIRDDDEEAKFKKFSIRKDPEQCEAVADMESLVSPPFY
ncbi:hypothetical protein QQP08_015132 [Theobroma cacao]|nr:hypothetical protein QQP08_015132 [Theobroma cacao]